MDLKKVVNVLEPIARAIKCLESAHTNPADVFIFWYAIMATYKEMLEENPDDLSEATIGDIRAIINKRYDNFILKANEFNNLVHNPRPNDRQIHFTHVNLC